MWVTSLCISIGKHSLFSQVLITPFNQRNVTTRSTILHLVSFFALDLIHILNNSHSKVQFWGENPNCKTFNCMSKTDQCDRCRKTLLPPVGDLCWNENCFILQQWVVSYLYLQPSCCASSSMVGEAGSFWI